MMEVLIRHELDLLHLLQGTVTHFWSVFWTIVTYFGEGGIFWIALSLTLMIFKKTRKAGFAMGLALLMGVIVGNGILKNVIARPRPYTLDPTLSIGLAWGEMSKDFSFPSGHTLASFEAAGALFLHHKKSGIAALALAFLIAVSRLFLSVHYPTDVLAGAVLGLLFAFLAVRIIDLLYRKWEQRKQNA